MMRDGLRSVLTDALGDADASDRLELLGESEDLADASTKLLVRDRARRPSAVVLVSSPVDPGQVARGMQIASRVKRALGPDLGRVILEPLAEGVLDGVSYALLPYRDPLSRRKPLLVVQRWWLRQGILRWLARVTDATAREMGVPDLEGSFERPLRYVAGLDPVDRVIRDAAASALERLSAGRWQPRYVLMHGDLWAGNLLLDTASEGVGGLRRSDRFVIIDWPGATMNGYAMYDLIRLSMSMVVRGRRLRREVDRHCRSLGCEHVDAMGYLLAALGNVGMNPGCFARDQFLEMTRVCFERLRGAVRL